MTLGCCTSVSLPAPIFSICRVPAWSSPPGPGRARGRAVVAVMGCEPRQEFGLFLCRLLPCRSSVLLSPLLGSWQGAGAVPGPGIIISPGHGCLPSLSNQTNINRVVNPSCLQLSERAGWCCCWQCPGQVLGQGLGCAWGLRGAPVCQGWPGMWLWVMEVSPCTWRFICLCGFRESVGALGSVPHDPRWQEMLHPFLPRTSAPLRSLSSGQALFCIPGSLNHGNVEVGKAL